MGAKKEVIALKASLWYSDWSFIHPDKMKTAWFSFLLFGESNTERFHYRSDTQLTKETDLEQTSIHKCKDFSESEAKL